MSGRTLPLAGKAAALKRAFDLSFAKAPVIEQISFEDFLAIRVGPDPYAVRIAEVSGLYADQAVTKVPSPMKELLGITGFRGAIVAVHDLRALLGYPTGETPRWLMVAAEAPVGLAFDAFEGHLRFPRGTAAQAESTEHRSPYVRGVLNTGDEVRWVVHVTSILETLKRRAQAGAQQERP